MFLLRSVRVAPQNRDKPARIRSQQPRFLVVGHDLARRAQSCSRGPCSNPVPIAIGAPVSGNLSQGGADFYRDPAEFGRSSDRTDLQALDGLELRLSLFDGQGNLLVQSDGQSSGRLNPLIDQHVAAGADILEVQSLSGSGTYSLSTSLTPASDPAQTLALPANFQGSSYAPIAVGDFTNNGDPRHRGPGRRPPGDRRWDVSGPVRDRRARRPQPQSPSAIAVGDFNSDHNLDVAVALAATDSVSISLGNGDGTFQPASTIGLSVAGVPDAIVAGDFGNGQTDLAVAIAEHGRCHG